MAYLQNRERSQDDTVEQLRDTFGRQLAARIGDDPAPEGYVLATELLLYDCQTGVDGFTQEPMPHNLTGYPPQVYGALRVEADYLAQQIFGEEFAQQATQFRRSAGQ